MLLHDPQPASQPACEENQAALMEHQTTNELSCRLATGPPAARDAAV